MVVTALMAGSDPNARTIFDGLVRWVLDHPSSIHDDLLAAEQDANCESVEGTASATDADLDVAYGLLLAHRQWGSGGELDYQDLALRRIEAIARSEVDPDTHLTRLGDFAAEDDDFSTVSRSSDWMLGHFRTFADATGDDAWDEIADAHQSAIDELQREHAPDTGLLPDFVQDTDDVVRPAEGEVLESPDDGQYSWNACRVPWRLGTAAVLHDDEASREAAQTMSRWIRRETEGDPADIRGGYRLDGTPLSDANEPAFVAGFAVAAMTDDGPEAQQWLDALWEQMVQTPIDPGRYYAASLTLQALLVVSGNAL